MIKWISLLLVLMGNVKNDQVDDGVFIDQLMSEIRSINEQDVSSFEIESKVKRAVANSFHDLAMGQYVNNRSGRTDFMLKSVLPFYMSNLEFDSADLDSAQQQQQSASLSTLPIIMPAAAQLTLPSTNEKKNAQKKKKNFSQLAKSLLVAAKSMDKKSSNDTNKATRSYTSTKKLNGYCNYKTDGLYDDPTECENFIICFASRTFRTKCAYGTMWNHVRKECDFPEKVDCDRKATTPETTTTTTIEETTTTKSTTTKRKSTAHLIAPKLSAFTVRTNKVQTYTVDKNLASSMKTNIMLTIIIIPTGILVLILILITLWFWHRKFKLERTKFEFKNDIKMSPSKKEIINKSLSDENSRLHGGSRRALLVKKFTCCCWEKLAHLAAHRKQFKPKMINHQTNGLANHADLIRCDVSKPHNLNNSLTINYPTQNMAPCLTVKESAPPAVVTIAAPPVVTIKEAAAPKKAINECQIATGSHATLSSHFEENNWDYNFATRGLYLSQPWVRGRYTHTLGSESIATSAVLTLDPTTEISCDMIGNKFVEIYGETGGSDTDGYYA